MLFRCIAIIVIIYNSQTSIISEAEMVELLQAAGVTDPDKIDRADFEAFIDMIVDEDEGWGDEEE